MPSLGPSTAPSTGPSTTPSGSPSVSGEPSSSPSSQPSLSSAPTATPTGTPTCMALKHTPGTPFINEDKISLVFVGSGFTDSSDFATNVDNIYSVFTQYNAFGSSVDLLNVFYVDILSPSFCHFNCSGIDRLLCCDVPKTYELTENCVPRGESTQTIVIHNDMKYGGAGYLSANIGTTSINVDAPLVAVHELGHSMFELGDEYNGGSSKANSPNCAASGCDKWSDLIGHDFGGAYNDVMCLPDQCQGGADFVGEVSIMNLLDRPFGAVNERFTCCTYLAFTGSAPAYCNAFELSLGDLLDYCKSNDYQGYGDVYPPSPAGSVRRVLTHATATTTKYKNIGSNSAVLVRLGLGNIEPSIQQILPARPGLYRKESWEATLTHRIKPPTSSANVRSQW